MVRGKIGIIPVISLVEGESRDTGKEFLRLLLILALQLVFIPSLGLNLQIVDIVTPWLVYKFITKPMKQTFFIFLIASFSLETAFASAAGLYLSAYFVIFLLTYYVLENIAWKSFRPWFSLITGSVLWVGGYEIFAHFLTSASVPHPTFLILQLSLRVTFAAILGFVLFRKVQFTSGEC